MTDHLGLKTRSAVLPRGGTSAGILGAKALLIVRCRSALTTFSTSSCAITDTDQLGREPSGLTLASYDIQYFLHNARCSSVPSNYQRGQLILITNSLEALLP